MYLGSKFFKMHRPAIKGAGLLLCMLVLGCGGNIPGIKNASLKLSASPNPAPYNIPIKISWGGTGVKSITKSNFGVESDQTSGSITDNPGVDSTYTLTATLQNPGHDPFSGSESVVATVVKSTKGILIIGDASVAGPSQVQQSLQSLTTGSVSVSATLPATTTQGVVIIHPTASLSTSDRIALDSLVSAKIPVIFIGSTVKAISGNNVASIGGYLGGATRTNGDYDQAYRSAAGFVPVSSRYYGARLDGALFTPFQGLGGVSTQADRLIGNSSCASAFAYRLPSGEKTGFVQEDGVGSSNHSKGFDLALRLISRWCMDGS